MRDVKTVHRIAILAIVVNVAKMDAAVPVVTKSHAQWYVMDAKTAHPAVNHASVPIVAKTDVTVRVAHKKHAAALRRHANLDAVKDWRFCK